MNKLSRILFPSFLAMRFAPLSKSIVFLGMMFSFSASDAQSISKIEPPNWWKGFSFDTVQIMVYGKDLKGATVSSTNQGIEILKSLEVSNPDYLVFTARIGESAPLGKSQFLVKKGRKTMKVDWTLSARESNEKVNQGLNGSDVVYLIMPDRFANGNPKNDTLPQYAEGVRRSNPDGRHGGDLEGVIKNLNYLQNLGVTTLWLTPVYANNQPKYSYHGYSITDFYKVDDRFGGNGLYKKLIDEAHKKGLKIVKDMVFNHIGTGHQWTKGGYPDDNWVNQQNGQELRTNFRISTIHDPNGSNFDKRKMLDGWFDTHMPDMNQKHPILQTYLIQQTLWWLQEFGIDGIRMDTYPYPELDLMNKWVNVVTKEFPKIYLVGEVWVNHVPQMAYYVSGGPGNKRFPGNLPAATDFPLCFKIPAAFNEKGKWDAGLVKLYDELSMDFMYPKPENFLLFADNHDLSRMFLSLNRNLASWKMAVAFMLTTKRIPQFYYGVECLWDGDAVKHPNVRLDFPGGWEGDQVNFFTETNLSADQRDACNYLKTLLNWRKTKRAIKDGKLLQFVPEENIYVYFRIVDNETVMVVINGNEKDSSFKLDRFAEGFGKFTKGINLISGNSQDLNGSWTIPAKTAWILELK